MKKTIITVILALLAASAASAAKPDNESMPFSVGQKIILTKSFDPIKSLAFSTDNKILPAGTVLISKKLKMISWSVKGRDPARQESEYTFMKFVENTYIVTFKTLFGNVDETHVTMHCYKRKYFAENFFRHFCFKMDFTYDEEIRARQFLKMLKKKLLGIMTTPLDSEKRANTF